MSEFKTADGVPFLQLLPLEKIFLLVKPKDSRAYVKETIVLAVSKKILATEKEDWSDLNDGQTKEEFLKTIYHTKANAEYEEFRVNKLSYTNKADFDFKETFKKAIGIINNFSDKELLEFVKNNSK
jgi:hypothetical protein